MLKNLLAKDPYSDLIDFIDAAAYSVSMSFWLERLESEPDSARIIHLAEMKSRMEHNGEPDEYIAILGLLENRAILKAMNRVIREVKDSGEDMDNYINGGGGDGYHALVALMAPTM